jgi:hypothetical protein
MKYLWHKKGLGFGAGEEAAFCANSVTNFHLCNICDVIQKAVMILFIPLEFPVLHFSSILTQ